MSIEDNKRLLEEEKNRLQRLKEKKLEIEEELKNNSKLKQMGLRSLRIFKALCIGAIPFAISFSIVCGIPTALGDNPFKRDKEKNYKRYDVSVDYEDDVFEYEEDYSGNRVESVDFEIYQPWKKDHDWFYSREIEHYRLNSACDFQELINALIAKDYNIINQNIVLEEKETVETTDSVDLTTGAIIKAKIKYYDSNDYIEVLEPINGDDGDKIVSFFFTIILGLLMSLITLDKVFEDIKEANSSYYNSQIEYLSGIDNISLLNGQIEDANQHILTLKREGGRKSWQMNKL